MSYDFRDLLNFQQSMSLDDFEKGLGSKTGDAEKGTKQTYVFSNSPASNFLSLNHKFGFSGGGKAAAAPELSIEFIDPEGTFEDSWFKKDIADLVPIQDDPLGYKLQLLKNKLLGYETLLDRIENGDLAEKFNTELEGGGNILDGATENNLEDQVEATELEIETLEEVIESDDAADIALDLIQKQIDANSSQLQRPVWITYGLGDDLNDWTPVMCFDRCTAMEYSFTGGGARTLKLVYSGVGIHPNLTQMGIGPMKGFNLGISFTGESNPIFNREAGKIQDKVYEPLFAEVGAEYVGDVWKPSIHKIIRDAIRRFVKQAVGMNTNVLCILPDLDKYLKPEYDRRYKEVQASMAAMIYQSDEEDNWEEITANLQTTKEVIETCGFKFVEEYNDGIQVAVGSNVWERIEDISNPAQVMKWLQTKDITALISADGVEESIQEKIASVMEKIKETVDDLGAIPDFSPYWYVECDHQMLQVMYKHFGGRAIKAGLAPNEGYMYESNSVGEAFKPVVVVGDRTTIMSYLQARIFDQQTIDDKGNVISFNSDNPIAEQEAHLKKAVTNQINPYDQADGLTYNFLKDIYDITIPVPWLSPFGGSTGLGSGENSEYLPNDTNIPQGDLEKLKAEQPLSTPRMPVFALGTKNPNVLSLDIDINKQYYNLMNTVEPANRSAQQYTTAIMGKGSEDSQEVTEIFNAIAELNLKDLDKNGIPKGFVAIVDPYWDQNMAILGSSDAYKAGGEIDDMGGVEVLFDTFGSANDMPELVDLDGTDFVNKDAFVKFMWDAFKAIGETYKSKPKAKKQVGGKGVSGGKNAIMTAAKMADSLAAQALLGTITTLPMFHLSNDRRVVNRKALLYCIEPRFAAGKTPFEEGSDELKSNLTWFSGTYIMTGFEHTISSTSVQSSFAINRPQAL